MRDFLSDIKDRILIHDGSKGYLLQKLGLKGGECGELWNLEKKEEVRAVYRQYREAGSDVLQTNTFPGNRVQLEKYSLGDRTYDINYWGARLAREVAGDDLYVSGSVGPTGILFKPSGEMDFQRAHDIFSEQVRALADGGADIINFETFTDVAELRAALIAAKENTNLPVICSLAFEAGGRTLMGTDVQTSVAVLKALGADMVGTNCSFGAEHMVGVVKTMYEAGGGNLSVKPNAGLPEVGENGVVYHETAQDFAGIAPEFARNGARLIGGCCGTTPEYIRALKDLSSNLPAALPAPSMERVIASRSRSVPVGSLDWSNMGRLDAGSDRKLCEELEKGSLSFIEDLALDIASEGYDALYINIDAVKPGLLSEVVDTLQGYVKEPFILETENSEALEAALRIYCGIAGVIIGDAQGAQGERMMKAVEKYGAEIIKHK